VTLEDLSLRKDMPKERLKDRFELLKGINGSMATSRRRSTARGGTSNYGKAYDLVLSGKARDAMDLSEEPAR